MESEFPNLSNLAKFRLIVYTKMLRDYRIARIFPFLSKKLNVDLGMCKYLSITLEQSIKCYPELIMFAPNKNKDHPTYLFWFKPFRKTPRIKILKQAISECHLDYIKKSIEIKIQLIKREI